LENLKVKVHSEYLGVEGKTLLKSNLKETGRESVDWIHLAQHSDRWWSLVNTVMKSRVP